MKIGVFIGSFNPVHKGHIKMANSLIDNNIVDKVLIVPTLSYWSKINIDIKDRIKMLEFYETDKIIIEKELNHLKYTYELINELKKRYPTDELYLVIGADNIINFDKWKKYKELLKLKLVIFKRENINVKQFLEKLKKKDNYIIVDNESDISFSSTRVRNNINNPRILEILLDKEIIDYINKNNLYRG